jgi:hypothetical protein
VAALVVATGLVGLRVATKTASTAALPADAPAPVGSEESRLVPFGGATVTATASALAAHAAAPPPAATARVESTDRVRPDPPATRVDASARTTESLIAALGSSDGFLVVEAADELAERKATSAIPSLVAMDIAKNPRSAPSVIEALGSLGSSADAAGRKTATDRLLVLLAQERARKAPESAANILALYTALGQTQDPRAATALEAELADPRVTLAAKTAVVEALVRLRQPTSRAALRALQQHLPTVVAADAFEEAVRHDLELAVDRALHAVP